MKDLIIPRNTIQFLQEHGISAKKRYGQNFLIDPRVLKRIIEGAGITKADTVLEIGPGIGTMTQALCEAAGHVIAVEIDRDMIPLLEENLAGYDNYEVINDDILKVDLKALAERISDRAENAGGAEEPAAAGGKFKVVANLPYYITTPIIMGLLEQDLPLDSITVMVQKEVAERMQAQPGTKDYGALTLAVQYYTNAEIIANVPANCFIPRPNVDSAVIRLSLHEERPVRPADEAKMFRVIRASFAQRRKTLVNGLKNDPALQTEGIDRGRAEAALKEMGLDPNVRGERLSLAEFARLSDLL
ncbi:MAG: 16S rRNA (adenine(1518)-N(6)/adenine(1519)-N(6))-dimethyltransferase RsmA [Lachnospiraceae bacterium]|nr:16S rRNA (adenine(1518)-N(6)/adenine(1519)-N(6))-dimethyltransferase RsmA [Lachnospiraceae bacterium]